MDRGIAEHIVNACNNEGVEARLYENYSGRGMYGKTTMGVVVESLEDVLKAVINCSYSLKGYGVDCIRSDSLGRNIIIY